MVLLVDNYDSFVHNLGRYLRELGEAVEVRRNDAIDLDELARSPPTHIVISPGPCTPAEAGVSVELLSRLGDSVPVLGVCLGHQCVGAAFGGRIVRAARPMHGKTSEIYHAGGELFEGLPNPFRATRYHSLLVDRSSIGGELEVTAWTEDGEVMAVRHTRQPVWGVQFHPEALMTEGGFRLLANFLALGRGEEPPGTALSEPPDERVRP